MQLDPAAVTERMRVKLGETRPAAESLDDLPDPVVGHTTLLPVASAGAVTHHEHRVLTATTNPLLREVLGQDGFRLTFAFWGVGTFIPTYVGTVAAKSGLSAADWAGLAGLVTSVGGVAGFISLGFLADAVGRKPVAMLFYFMCLILTPVVYLWAHNIYALLFLVGLFGFSPRGSGPGRRSGCRSCFRRTCAPPRSRSALTHRASFPVLARSSPEA